MKIKQLKRNKNISHLILFLTTATVWMMGSVSITYGQEAVKEEIQIDKGVVMDTTSLKHSFNGQVEEMKWDSARISEETEALKQEFRKDLESSLNGLVLSDLSKDDVDQRVSGLLNYYKNHKKINQVSEYDDQFMEKLGDFGNEEVIGEWLNDKITYTKIFDEHPQKILKDKQILKKSLREKNELKKQKATLLNNWEGDEYLLNQYHKYLGGSTDFKEFKKSAKSVKDRSSRKRNMKMLKKAEVLDRKEAKLKKELDKNQYVKQLYEDHGDELGQIKEIRDNGGLDEDMLNRKLNQQVDSEELSALLNNDYLSSKVVEHQNSIGKVGAGVIKREVVEALDSTQEDWLKNAEKALKDPEKDKEEISEIILKDSHKDKVMPQNMFFDGIVSFANRDFAVFSISPNVGYEFRKGTSVGAGLTLHHTEDKEAHIRTALDYKIFGRQEFFKNVLFIQTEYIAMVPGISYLNVRDGNYGYNNTMLIGGGFNLKIKEKLMFSFGLMYNINQSMGVPTYDSPILSRFGVKIF